MPEPSKPRVPDLGKIIHELEPSAAFQVSPPMQTTDCEFCEGTATEGGDDPDCSVCDGTGG